MPPSQTRRYYKVNIGKTAIFIRTFRYAYILHRILKGFSPVRFDHSGERKQKVKLLQTCVGAIPRILPEGISKESLVELISRYNVFDGQENSKIYVAGT